MLCSVPVTTVSGYLADLLFKNFSGLFARPLIWWIRLDLTIQVQIFFAQIVLYKELSASVSQKREPRQLVANRTTDLLYLQGLN